MYNTTPTGDDNFGGFSLQITRSMKEQIRASELTRQDFKENINMIVVAGKNGLSSQIVQKHSPLINRRKVSLKIVIFRKSLNVS